MYVERVDALHRRRGVRHGRRDRNSTQKLHARGPIGCASSPPTSSWSKAPGRSASSRFARRHPRRSIQPAAHRPPGVCTGGARAARARACVFMPVGVPRREIELDPGAEVRLEMVELAWRTTSASRRRGSSWTGRAVVHVGHAGAAREGVAEGRAVPDPRGDQAAALASWHEPEQVLERATVAVFERRSWGRNAIMIKIGRLRGPSACATSTCR